MKKLCLSIIGAILALIALSPVAFAARTQSSWLVSDDGTYIYPANALNVLLPLVNGYLNFGTFSGFSGYGFRDNGGTMQFKNNGGSWQNFGTGSGGGGGGAGTFSTTSPFGTTQVQYPTFSPTVTSLDQSATSTSKWWFDPVTALQKITGSFWVTASSTLQNFTFVNATGTQATTTSLATAILCLAGDCRTAWPPSGTVTSVSVASANGFAGSSSGGATPSLTLSTSVTGIVKGNGMSLSAASNGTDYSLITANTCSAGNHFSQVTAAGAFTCTADSGGGGGGSATNNWSTTTNGVALYPNGGSSTGIVIGAQATDTNALVQIFPQPNLMSFSVSSTSSGFPPFFEIEQSGNVGIGTSTAQAKLSIMAPSGVSTTSPLVDISTSSLSANQSVIARISNGGLVGFGTTTILNTEFAVQNLNNATNILGLYTQAGTVAATLSNTPTFTVGVGANSDNMNGAAGSIAFGGGTMNQNIFSMNNSSSATFRNNVATAGSGMLYGGSLAVASFAALQSTMGVGTTDAVRFLGGNNGSIEFGRFQDTSGIVNATVGSSTNSGGTLNSTLLVASFNQSSQNQFTVASSTAGGATSTSFVVAPNGNVGVATSTPTSPFSLNGAFSWQNAPTSGTTLDNVCLTNSNQVVVTTGGCTISTAADKTNIVPLSGVLQEMLQIQPVSYELTDDALGDQKGDPNLSKEQIGLVAQQVLPIIPDLVTVDPTTLEPRTIRYDVLAVWVLKAFQEAYSNFFTEISSLTDRMTGAESNIVSLQAQVDALQSEIAQLQKPVVNTKP